jgi:hypothetical protein
VSLQAVRLRACSPDIERLAALHHNAWRQGGATAFNEQLLRFALQVTNLRRSTASGGSVLRRWRRQDKLMREGQQRQRNRRQLHDKTVHEAKRSEFKQQVRSMQDKETCYSFLSVFFCIDSMHDCRDMWGLIATPVVEIGRGRWHAVFRPDNTFPAPIQMHLSRYKT